MAIKFLILEHHFSFPFWVLQMDFVFCYIQKNPNSKSNVSTPNNDQHQLSQNLVSDAEIYATEKTSAEVS